MGKMNFKIIQFLWDVTTCNGNSSTHILLLIMDGIFLF